MHNIAAIRKDPKAFAKAMARRKINENIVEQILQLDQNRRTLIQEIEALKSQNTHQSKEIHALSKGPFADRQLSDIKESIYHTKSIIADKTKELQKIAENLNTILSTLPNILDDSVPDGESETDNVVIHTKMGSTTAQGDKEHWELGENLGLMDFQMAAKVSGSRFVILKGALAKLERCLGQFMLDAHIEKGYTEYQVPVLVNTKAMYGTDKLPKFADQSFQTKDNKWLIPTGEVPLTYMAADSVLNGEFPKRHVALTNCFRSEAGSAGRDTKGMLRQHQFQKVEMVSYTKPDQSDEELLRMLECAEHILEMLDIPFRRVLLCSGDTGFGAAQTYDIEVWLPGQKAWREISSCSNTKDFQARRMNAKFQDKKERDYIHTLNGSGLAVGRTLIAVMENYQTKDGHIRIPDCLIPRMNMKII